MPAAAGVQCQSSAWQGVAMLVFQQQKYFKEEQSYYVNRKYFFFSYYIAGHMLLFSEFWPVHGNQWFSIKSLFLFFLPPAPPVPPSLRPPDPFFFLGNKLSPHPTQTLTEITAATELPTSAIKQFWCSKVEKMQYTAVTLREVLMVSWDTDLPTQLPLLLALSSAH